MEYDDRIISSDIKLTLVGVFCGGGVYLLVELVFGVDLGVVVELGLLGDGDEVGFADVFGVVVGLGTGTPPGILTDDVGRRRVVGG